MRIWITRGGGENLDYNGRELGIWITNGRGEIWITRGRGENLDYNGDTGGENLDYKGER